MSLAKWLSSAQRIRQQLAGSRQEIIAKIKRNPYYRFQSAQEIGIAAELGIKIDVNLASVDDWLRLPGISITQARNLVEITNSGIHFFCLEDLASALGVSVLKIQFWQPILYFAYYAPDSFHAPAKVNLNSATIQQLQTIPNLELGIAQKMILNRETNGAYRNLADLQKRLSLKPDFTYHLMQYLQF
jgi:DNA uptake protein ComE-like DNA-binding protein